LAKINNLQGVHDFHIWELADDLIIATLHASVFDTDANHSETVKEDIKKVLHRYGIHSNTIQIDIISAENDESPFICKHNCMVNCVEEWCCKGENEEPQAKKNAVVELK